MRLVTALQCVTGGVLMLFPIFLPMLAMILKEI
jgi:hypothetical protein